MRTRLRWRRPADSSAESDGIQRALQARLDDLLGDRGELRGDGLDLGLLDGGVVGSGALGPGLLGGGLLGTGPLGTGRWAAPLGVWVRKALASLGGGPKGCRPGGESGGSRDRIA